MIRQYAPVIAAVLMALLTACNTPQPSATLQRFELEGVGDTPLPAPIFDGTINAPEGAFHLRIEAVSGWFSTNNQRYEHGVDLRAYVNGQAQPIRRWRDQGRCTPSGTALSCQSEFIQNVSFDVQHGAAVLSITQDLSGEGVAARYVYGRKQPN